MLKILFPQFIEQSMKRPSPPSLLEPELAEPKSAAVAIAERRALMMVFIAVAVDVVRF